MSFTSLVLKIEAYMYNTIFLPPPRIGRPTTLGAALVNLIPLLFPEPTSNSRRRLARAFVHGIQMPLETELGWLGTVMCSADGWVSAVIHLGR